MRRSLGTPGARAFHGNVSAVALTSAFGVGQNLWTRSNRSPIVNFTHQKTSWGLEAKLDNELENGASAPANLKATLLSQHYL